jgi:hypothetical protein
VNIVEIKIEVEGGMATVANITAPPNTPIRIVIRDYDTDGNDPDDLDKDENGRPCFEYVAEYCSMSERPGFV